MRAIPTRPFVGAAPAGRLRTAGGVVLYLALYVALDWISLIEPFGALGIAPWNPPAGLTFVLFLLYGWRFVPVALAAVLLTDILFRDMAQAPLAMLASALVIAGGYGLAASVLRERLRIALTLDSHRDLWRLLTVAGVASGIVAAVAVAIFSGAGLLVLADSIEAALHFWVGDLIGIAVFTPFILLLLDRSRPLPVVGGRAVLEYGLQFVAIAAGLWIIFGLESANHFEFSYVLFLPLIWIGLREGLQGAVWGIAATQLGLIAAVQLKGFDADIVTQFQLLMLAVAVTGLALGSGVDERRRAEEARRESESRLKDHEAELAQAARVTATGEMAGALAHELNQPLTALIGFARACQAVLETPERSKDVGIEAHALIDHAVQQALRVGDIIRSSREFLRQGDTQLVKDHLPRLFATASDLMRARAVRHGVDIAIEADDRLPPVFVDPIQIEQVIVNLLRNSIDALVLSDAATRRITLSAAPAAGEPDFVEVAVRDTGPGFSAEVAGHLFTPFASTKEGGMGLGLSISRSLIEAHGGRIWVHPAPRGAEIRFTLPVYADER
jgi:two-component system, LuxR family, sensor kinase FixL